METCGGGSNKDGNESEIGKDEKIENGGVWDESEAMTIVDRWREIDRKRAQEKHDRHNQKVPWTPDEMIDPNWTKEKFEISKDPFQRFMEQQELKAKKAHEKYRSENGPIRCLEEQEKPTTLRCMYGKHGNVLSEVMARPHVIYDDIVYTIDEWYVHVIAHEMAQRRIPCSEDRPPTHTVLYQSDLKGKTPCDVGNDIVKAIMNMGLLREKLYLHFRVKTGSDGKTKCLTVTFELPWH